MVPAIIRRVLVLTRDTSIPNTGSVFCSFGIESFMKRAKLYLDKLPEALDPATRNRNPYTVNLKLKFKP